MQPPGRPGDISILFAILCVAAVHSLCHTLVPCRHSPSIIVNALNVLAEHTAGRIHQRRRAWRRL